MSVIEVKVPQLSESVSEATLLTWNKKVGEAVTEGESLIDIETDKVVLDLPAVKSGVLTKIIKTEGAKVTSNEVIAEIDTEAAVSAVAAAAPSVAQAPAQAAAGSRRSSSRGVPQATPSTLLVRRDLFLALAPPRFVADAPGVLGQDFLVLQVVQELPPHDQR